MVSRARAARARARARRRRRRRRLDLKSTDCPIAVTGRGGEAALAFAWARLPTKCCRAGRRGRAEHVLAPVDAHAFRLSIDNNCQYRDPRLFATAAPDSCRR